MQPVAWSHLEQSDMGGITGVDEETLQVGLKHTLKEVQNVKVSSMQKHMDMLAKQGLRNQKSVFNHKMSVQDCWLVVL